MRFRGFRQLSILPAVRFAVYFSILLWAAVAVFDPAAPRRAAAAEKQAAIENALYARTEFFGARAIVPFPTETARDRLAEILPQYPGDAEILLKLAELDEKLGQFDAAEQALAALRPENPEPLARFYGRRGWFEKQAAALEEILRQAPAEKRAAAFSNLIALARKHELKKYLAAEFYQPLIAGDESAGDVFLAFVDRLVADKNYAEALRILDQNKSQFPASSRDFRAREISILILEERTADAEKAYAEAFDPLWTDEEAAEFYGFLREHDRYRAYESELRRKFRLDPADFQTAIRLIHFRQHENEEIGALVEKLAAARTARRVAWQPNELLTVSRFLLKDGDGDRAARFLYTLCTDFRIEKQTDLRRRVLYQLFEILSDADQQSISLTRGNLDFYQTVGRADVHPGITTGILSLLFSDTDPGRRFDDRRQAAVRLFNRAAAYRIFQEFRSDYPDAPELAQMYLDIVRFYTAAKNLEIAGQTLAEFEGKYTGFTDFPDAALKLADAYLAAGQIEKERAVYRMLLDHLGKTGRPKFAAAEPRLGDLTLNKPSIAGYPPNSNAGINVSTTAEPDDYYDSRRTPGFPDRLAAAPTGEISYADVLGRLVGSLARENKTADILGLYAAETAKYPTETRLYEQLLEWLGQTNLTGRQEEVYRQALQNFPDHSWKNRFARWLIRNQRRAEFADLSRELVAAFENAETEGFLRDFIDGKEAAAAASPDGQLYFALYSLAHRRFPHNPVFTKGLLRYYRNNKMAAEWQNLMAEYYFEAPEIRDDFLDSLAQKGELGAYLQKAAEASAGNAADALPYKLFRADAAVRVADFEKAVVFYRELNQLYPNDPEFSEKFFAIARSFGQTNRSLLLEAAAFAEARAAHSPADENLRIRAGELQAELGDYEKARRNWRQIFLNAAGENESYLSTATVFWDYFQFDEALRTIAALREKARDKNLYAFQAGAIREAKNEKPAAVREYLRALDENRIDADRQSAKRRLKQLFQNPELAAVIKSGFESERRSAKNAFQMAFNFADTLYQANRRPEAVETLLAAVGREKSKKNLFEARSFFEALDEPGAVRATLYRLVETADNPRDAIAFRLRLAEHLRETYEPAKAAATLAGLVEKFPTNYGVLKEAETFYWDLGKREKSLAVLRAARGRARGEYLYHFSRKLARRLNSLNRPLDAEPILAALLAENPNDAEVFEELTEVYVRAGRAAELRKSFAATLEALEKQDLELPDFKIQARALREKMISAFTRLKDFDSAAEQYIESINREPENEALLDAAINFAKRYGGTEKLLDYYRKTAAESFKNYRWNVVLARLHETRGDYPNAAENYRTAIFNQPEMTALYESLGEIYLKMPDYPAALENVGKLLEMSGDDRKYLKQRILILEKLGRTAEAEAEKSKLPAGERPKPPTLPEQFAEARNLQGTETRPALEKYRLAFENLAQNPTAESVRAADLTGYVRTVHTVEPLDSITARLWTLRGRLAAEIADPDSVKSGRARENLAALDGAFAEAVGFEIKTKATGDEIRALRGELEARLEAAAPAADPAGFSLLQNLIYKCGFDELREKMLLKNLENSAAPDARNEARRALTAFYRKRGDLPRILALLENELAALPPEFVKLYAETAQTLDEPDRELAARRIIFADQTAAGVDAVDRYLEILSARNRPELESVARNPGAKQLAVINFLLAAGETALAREAIANSSFPVGWKTVRMGQTSLLTASFAPPDEKYFIDSLNLAPLGELVKQRPDERLQATGGNWFGVANLYGRWLFAAAQKEKAGHFLAAGIESRPKSADEQFNLGLFYHRQQEFARAREHFDLARELRPDDPSFLPFAGAAYFKLNEPAKAFAIWAKIIDGEAAGGAAALYLKTLADFGHSAKARRDLKPVILKKLDELEDGPNDSSSRAELKTLLGNLAGTFAAEADKTAYFLELCKAARNDAILPRMVIDEALVERRGIGEFYRISIERAEAAGSYDYDFKSLSQTGLDSEEAELLYDAENDFELKESGSEKLARQRNYLEFLLENQDFAAAAGLISEIEDSLKGEFPRPVWLRLANFRVSLASGNEAAALAKMLKFTGVEISPSAEKAVPPNLDRLNRAAALLAGENRTGPLRALREAFYARQLALGQYDAANFSGLARVRLERGDTAEAVGLFEIMTNFADPEMWAKLDSLPVVIKFSNRENLPVESRRDLSEPVSLTIAAETLTEFGVLESAAAFRERLRAVAPDNAVNRLELARLYANLKPAPEAARLLLEIAADRTVERQKRWQSLLVLAEIGGADENFWRRILAENQNFEQADVEIRIALKAFAAAQTGRPAEALELLKDNRLSPPLKFLNAIFERNAGSDGPALVDFGAGLDSGRELEEIFGFFEPAPLLQMIDLYLRTGRDRAALELAKKSPVLSPVENFDPPAERSFKFKTLAVRARLQRFDERLRLLEDLSRTAEKTGDFALAAEFEKTRGGFLTGPEERQASADRIAGLGQKSAQKNRARENVLSVGEQIASGF